MRITIYDDCYVRLVSSSLGGKSLAHELARIKLPMRGRGLQMAHMVLEVKAPTLVLITLSKFGLDIGYVSTKPVAFLPTVADLGLRPGDEQVASQVGEFCRTSNDLRNKLVEHKADRYAATLTMTTAVKAKAIVAGDLRRWVDAAEALGEGEFYRRLADAIAGIIRAEFIGITIRGEEDGERLGETKAETAAQPAEGSDARADREREQEQRQVPGEGLRDRGDLHLPEARQGDREGAGEEVRPGGGHREDREPGGPRQDRGGNPG